MKVNPDDLKNPKSQRICYHLPRNKLTGEIFVIFCVLNNNLVETLDGFRLSLSELIDLKCVIIFWGSWALFSVGIGMNHLKWNVRTKQLMFRIVLTKQCQFFPNRVIKALFKVGLASFSKIWHGFDKTYKNVYFNSSSLLIGKYTFAFILMHLTWFHIAWSNHFKY